MSGETPAHDCQDGFFHGLVSGGKCNYGQSCNMKPNNVLECEPNCVLCEQVDFEATVTVDLIRLCGLLC